jgi:hypothetical protein
VNRDVAELPGAGHNPDMAGLEDLVRNVADLMYAGYQKGGLVSGGFYFEWTDEWWKADAGNPAYRSDHVGNLPYVNYFPGCGDDAAWYGLNSIKRGGGLDEVTARPTLDTLKNTWAQEQP